MTIADVLARCATTEPTRSTRCGLRLTLRAGDQFIQVARAVQSFTVPAGQRFGVAAGRRSSRVTPGRAHARPACRAPYAVDAVVGARPAARRRSRWSWRRRSEDIERLRRTHWVELAYRPGRRSQLAALVGRARRWPGRSRRRVPRAPDPAGRRPPRGSVGPTEIARFVFEYLRAAEDALGRPDAALPATLVPGLRRAGPGRRLRGRSGIARVYRPLALVENPRRTATQHGTLADARQPGPLPAPLVGAERGPRPKRCPRSRSSGRPAGRPPCRCSSIARPGAWIGYRGVVRVGQHAATGGRAGDRPLARRHRWTAPTSRTALFGVAAHSPPAPASDPTGESTARPRCRAMREARTNGATCPPGFYDIRGLDRTFFAHAADDDLMEAAFDQTAVRPGALPGRPGRDPRDGVGRERAGLLRGPRPAWRRRGAPAGAGLADEVPRRWRAPSPSCAPPGSTAPLRGRPVRRDASSTGAHGALAGSPCRPEAGPTGTEQPSSRSAPGSATRAFGTTKFE